MSGACGGRRWWCRNYVNIWEWEYHQSVSVWEGWEAGARNEMEEDVAVTRAVCNRAGNEPSRKMKFHNHGEGLYFASTRAFSWLKALTSASTNEILC